MKPDQGARWHPRRDDLRGEPEGDRGWSIRKFVKTARRFRTIGIQAGRQTITAADPLPDDLHHALDGSAS